MTRWLIPQRSGFEQPSQVVDAFVEKLREHRLDLYPTGSRFMGGWRPESDWDFVMFDSPEVRAVLAELEFEDTFDGDYTGDEYTSGHMTRTQNEPGQIAENKIQVQLTPRVDILLGARDVIAQYLFSEHLKATSERRHEIWEAVMKVLNWKAEPDEEAEAESIETIAAALSESYPFAPENF